MQDIGKIYHKLFLKFLHDIATPVNSIGLILETLSIEFEPENLELCTKSHNNLVNLLKIYRKLAWQSDEKIEKTIEIIEKICQEKNVIFKDFIVEPWEGNLGSFSRLILCISYILLESKSHKAKHTLKLKLDGKSKICNVEINYSGMEKEVIQQIHRNFSENYETCININYDDATAKNVLFILLHNFIEEEKMEFNYLSRENEIIFLLSNK